MLVLLEAVVVETKRTSCGSYHGNSTMNKKGIYNQCVLARRQHRLQLPSGSAFGVIEAAISC
jgi:hypothetical protein